MDSKQMKAGITALEDVGMSSERARHLVKEWISITSMIGDEGCRELRNWWVKRENAFKTIKEQPFFK